MGMDVVATLAIGAVVYHPDGEFNQDREDIMEELDELLWDHPVYELEWAGSSDYQEYLIVRRNSKQSANWTAQSAKITSDLSHVEAKICFLKQFLKKHKLEYGNIGLLLFPYSSY